MKFYVDDIQKIVPDSVTIVAATKYFDANQMRELYALGIRDFGENRDDAFLVKHEQLADLDITWHFIGTLQTKKVKKIIQQIDCLHSLDSVKLAEEINKRRTSPLNCFIQVNISHEDSKHGVNPSDVMALLDATLTLPNVSVIGLMGMAELTDDMDLVSSQFQILNDLQKAIEIQRGISLPNLSIGMSNDYQVALKHKATHLRLGSVLFKKEV